MLCFDLGGGFLWKEPGLPAFQRLKETMTKQPLHQNVIDCITQSTLIALDQFSETTADMVVRPTAPQEARPPFHPFQQKNSFVGMVLFSTLHPKRLICLLFL